MAQQSKANGSFTFKQFNLFHCCPSPPLLLLPPFWSSHVSAPPPPSRICSAICVLLSFPFPASNVPRASAASDTMLCFHARKSTPGAAIALSCSNLSHPLHEGGSTGCWITGLGRGELTCSRFTFIQGGKRREGGRLLSPESLTGNWCRVQ